MFVCGRLAVAVVVCSSRVCFCWVDFYSVFLCARAYGLMLSVLPHYGRWVVRYVCGVFSRACARACRVFLVYWCVRGCWIVLGVFLFEFCVVRGLCLGWGVLPRAAFYLRSFGYPLEVRPARFALLVVGVIYVFEVFGCGCTSVCIGWCHLFDVPAVWLSLGSIARLCLCCICVYCLTLL